MPDVKTDKKRMHSLEGALQNKGFFYKMSIFEALGRPFFMRLDIISEDGTLSIDDMLGKLAGASILLPDVVASGKERYFHGLITNFLYLGPKGKKHRYRAEIRPHLWLLTQTMDSRVFQNQSVPKIIESIIKDKHGFTDVESNLKKTYSDIEYCIQYRESDFDFIHRLMEREGIYYYFKFDKTKHILVLCDGATCHSAIEGNKELPLLKQSNLLSESEHIYDWDRIVEMQPGKVTLSNYDYNKPDTKLEVRQQTSRNHPHSKLEVYDYPGRHVESEAGNSYAKIRNESYEAMFSHFEGQALCARLEAGKKFKLSQHPQSSWNKEYLITQLRTDVVSADLAAFKKSRENSFETSFYAIPASDNFRLPISTPAPNMGGPHTALVVGKQGEEIWTDEMGRIKIQFHWDREGQNDEKSSCWVRVMTPWAGNNWGALHIPRIGQEVIVQFIQGDPDRPLVIGSVYNERQKPPYNLPNEAYSSGIKSRTTKEGSAETFNEIRFEDQKDKELIYLHAERDFSRVVENNDLLSVGFDKKSEGDQTIKIFGSQNVEIGTDDSKSSGCQSVKIHKDQTETLVTGNRLAKIEKGNDTLELHGSRETTIKTGSDTVTIQSGNWTVNLAAGQCTIDAAKGIKLVVGGSKIEITQQSIVIESASIDIKGNGPVNVKGAVGSFDGGSTLVLKGGMVNIN